MVQVDSLRPKKKKTISGRKRKKPSQKEKATPVLYRQDKKKNLFWFLVAFSAIIVVIFWTYFLRININRTANSSDSVGIFKDLGDLGGKFSNAVESIREKLSNESLTNINEGEEANTEIKNLEEKVFPQFNAKD